MGQHPLHHPTERRPAPGAGPDPAPPARTEAGEIAWPDQQLPWAAPRPAGPPPDPGRRRLELLVVCLVVAAIVAISAGLVATAVALRDEPAQVTAGPVVPTRPAAPSDGEPRVGPPGPQLPPVEAGTTATFENGLQVGVTGMRVRRAKDKYERIVEVEVRITNNTGRPVDLFDVEVTARLGPEQRSVPRFSGVGGTSSKAGGTLPDGRTATLSFAFRIERPDDTERITVVVWPDWATGSASFTGTVTQP